MYLCNVNLKAGFCFVLLLFKTFTHKSHQGRGGQSVIAQGVRIHNLQTSPFFPNAGSIIPDMQFLLMYFFSVSIYAVGSVVCTETTHFPDLGFLTESLYLPN